MSARLEHRRAATRHLAAVAPRPELDPSLTPPVPSAGIISIASALYPYVALDANAYFDDAGFDDEMSAQLQAKLTEYIQSADGVVPSPEEHPQPRRLARYLLENVDYEEVRLLRSPPPRSPPPPSSPPPLPPPSTPPRWPTPPPSPPAPFPPSPASLWLSSTRHPPTGTCQAVGRLPSLRGQGQRRGCQAGRRRGDDPRLGVGVGLLGVG